MTALCFIAIDHFNCFAIAGTETAESNRIAYVKKREMAKAARGKPLKGSKDWIMAKKERRRRQGKETREDSRYTGRRRAGRF